MSAELSSHLNPAKRSGCTFICSYLPSVKCCYFHTDIEVQVQQACGPGSLIGIATGYGLDGPEIESRWRARFSAPVQTGPGVHPASRTMGTVSFPGVKSGRGVTLTPNPLLVPWSRKSRGTPLRPLWAVRPVQSLNACTRVHFTLLYNRLTVSFVSPVFSKFPSRSYASGSRLDPCSWYSVP